MTHPGNPDPNAQPQYGQPSQLPAQGYGQSGPAGYGAPPPPGYGQPQGYPSAPPPGYGGAPTNRPGMVTAAAVLAFISGGLGVLLDLLAFTVVGSFGVPGIYVLFVVLSLLVSAALIYGGVLAMQGKSFVILLVVAGVAILLNLISMIVYFSAGAILGLVIPILIIVFLLNPQSKAWITARGGKTLG